MIIHTVHSTQMLCGYMDGLVQERRNSSVLAMEFKSFLH